MPLFLPLKTPRPFNKLHNLFWACAKKKKKRHRCCQGCNVKLSQWKPHPDIGSNDLLISAFVPCVACLRSVLDQTYLVNTQSKLLGVTTHISRSFV